MKRFLLLIIVPILFFLGCNIKNNDYHVAYKGKYSFGFDDSNMTFLVSKCVKSLDELIKLCDDYSNGFYESNSSNYNDEVPKKIRSYDESFFRSNDLIIIVVGKNDAFDYIVHEVEDIDSTIVVKLRIVEDIDSTIVVKLRILIFNFNRIRKKREWRISFRNNR